MTAATADGGDGLGIEVRLVRVTPEVATEWLEKNDRNRKLREDRVKTLAGAIQRGEWKINGETIKLGPDGKIIDGQHRLWAVLEAGQPIDTFVVFGVEEDAQPTVDVGARRNLADALKWAGESNTSNLSAALNLIHLWRLGDSALRNPGSARLTPAQAFALMAKEGDQIRDALARAGMIRSAMNQTLTMSIVTACFLRFTQIDEEDAVTFWTRVGEGTGMKKNDPCYMLRESCTKNSKRRNKYPTLMMHALTIKAWNAFRAGREIQTLSWKMGGARPEPFPEPI